MKPPARRIHEWAVLSLMVLAPTLFVLGLVAWLAFDGLRAVLGLFSAVIGIWLLVASVGASYPLALFRSLFRSSTGGLEYDELRLLGRLKAAGILLNLLWAFAFIGLVLGTLDRYGLIRVRLPFGLGSYLAAALSIVLVLNVTYAHALSLRVPIRRSPNAPTLAYLFLGLSLSALPAGVALALLDRPLSVAGLALTSDESAALLLASAAFIAITLASVRALPNLLTVFRMEKGPSRARDYLTRTKAVFLPVATAFALLFVILLLLLGVGVGTVGIQSPIQLFVLGFVVIATIASVIVSIRFARTEDVAPLYTLKVSPEARTERVLLGVSLGIAGLFILEAALLAMGITIAGLDSSRWVDVLSIGLLIAVGPYGFYYARRIRRIRRLEERFPDFLRDVAASHRGGLTLAASVKVAARGDYGELTPDVVKMADQLSWNVSFNEALERLKGRVQTPLVERATTLILEASRSGGSTTEVLLAAARDAREIKNLENERRQNMALYGIIIYVTFFVFLGVAAVLYGQFIPEIIRAANAPSQLQAGAGALQLNVPSLPEYRAFYFTASLVQGAGNGIMAGMFQNGNARSGLRHAFVMILITYIAFSFIIQ